MSTVPKESGDNVAGSTEVTPEAPAAHIGDEGAAPATEQAAKAKTPPAQDREAEAAYFRATFTRRRSFIGSDLGEEFGPAHRFGAEE